MNRLKSTVLVVFAAVVALSVLFVPTGQVFAAESAALSIPPKKNYTVEAGKTVNDTLTIRNLDKKSSLNLSLKIVDFTFVDDGGAPKLMLADDAPQTTWSLKPFLKIPKETTIEPNSTKTIDMSISIPAGHGAGSYYSAIVYSSGGSDGGHVGLNASGVTLAFVNIPGQTKEDLKLEKLGAYIPNKAGSGRYVYFNLEKPLNIGYTLKNAGNVTESPVGSIKLKPLFGKEIDITDINPNGSLALIGQSRTFTPCIKVKSEEVNLNGSRSQTATCTEPDMWPGYYTVEFAAYYGQNGNNTQEITGRASFWYLPWWFILICMVVLAFVGYHIWKLVRFIKRKQGKAAPAKPKKRHSRRR
jgi:hypothetical protein